MNAFDVESLSKIVALPAFRDELILNYKREDAPLLQIFPLTTAIVLSFLMRDTTSFTDFAKNMLAKSTSKQTSKAFL